MPNWNWGRPCTCSNCTPIRLSYNNTCICGKPATEQSRCDDCWADSEKAKQKYQKRKASSYAFFAEKAQTYRELAIEEFTKQCADSEPSLVPYNMYYVIADQNKTLSTDDFDNEVQKHYRELIGRMDYKMPFSPELLCI